MTDEELGAPLPRIAGLWRRIFAFALDGVLLGTVGLAAGTVFFDQFVRLGAWGRVLGLPIEIAYFGSLNSALAGGRTPGKRLMRIKVVDGAGEALHPTRSAARAAVLAVPFTLNGVRLPPDVPLAAPLTALTGVIVFGAAGSILYLLLANRRTRQALHDLLVGSFVVTADSCGRVAARPWKGHFVVLALGCVAATVALRPWTAAPSEGRRASLARAHAEIEDLPLVQSAALFVGTQHWLDSDETRFVKVYLRLSHDPVDREATAAGFARAIVTALTEAKEADQVVVELSYGYDIGIAHWNRKTAHAWAPAAIPPSGRAI